MARSRDDYSALRLRIVLTILSGYGLALIVFFCYTLFTFPEKYFLGPFRLNWTMIQTAVYFIENLIPVNFAAALLACSLFAPPVPPLKSGLKEAFGRLISSTVVVFIIAGLIYVTLAEGFLPSLNRNLDELRNRTIIARSYFDLAEQAQADGDNALRKAYLEYYLTIDPGNQTAAKALENLRIYSSDDSGTGGGSNFRKQARLLNLRTDELISRAMMSVGREDFFTAYYFADLARALSPPGSADAERANELVTGIQAQLASFKASAEERTRKAIFEIKTQGHSDLSSDEVSLVARAYYTFLHLKERDPEDVEAKKYLKESADKLETMAFFRDEIEQFNAMPGINRLFFLNNEEDSENTQILAIGGIITTEKGTYAQDIEAVTVGPDGGVICRFSARAGKIMNDQEGRPAVFMFGLDRKNSSNPLLPVIHQGGCESILYIVPPLEDLRLLGMEGRRIESHHLTSLWGMWDKVAPYGYPADVIQIEALKRIATAFGFIILSLFALTLGWKLKPSGSVPVFIGALLIPVLPIAAYFLVRLYEYLLTLIIGSALLAWGFLPALIVLVALQFALLVMSLFTLASQSLKIRDLKLS
jgi:hypothetical protein